MKFLKKKNIVFPLLLLLVISIGGAFRFYDLNWDNYLIFHPDERNIAAAVTRISFFSKLNPGFFAYGGLPIYIYRAVGDLLNFSLKTQVWTVDWGHINVVGRACSAFFSTLTILFIFLVGKKMFSKKVALLASFIFACTVSSIQIAHYATTESFLILTISILLYISMQIEEAPLTKRFLLLGFLCGLAIAAKTTALSFFFIPLPIFLYEFAKTHKRKVMISLSFKILLFLVTAGFTFTIFSPYTFLAADKFLESMNYESGVATGTLVVPYTHQFDKAIPYLFELVNMLWQMGPIFLFSLGGFFIVFMYTFKKRHPEYLNLLVFPLIYFLYVGTWHAKFIRYMTPLLPFFVFYASFLLIEIHRKRKQVGIFLITFFATITFLWALSYMSIYAHPQTRYSASMWMYKNIKPADKVYTEHWDDGLPIHIDGIDKSIPTEQLTIYDNEFNGKAEYYADKLSSGNYVILVTRRLYGTLQYLQKEYPTTSKYYVYLFAGKLGYKKVAEFSSYPSLFGITINDDASEESFQVYDHPKITIFKNTAKLSKDELWNLLKS